MNDFESWKLFAVENREIEKESVRKIIHDSWIRSRSYSINPFFHGITTIPEQELEQRRQRKRDMLIAAMPHLHKLYKIICKSKTAITITDEEGIILESFYSEELKTMKNFPVPGTVHSEKICGTNGIGTALATGRPVQIIGAEHWLKDNHEWSCNTVPIIRDNRILGVLNLACIADTIHEHSLGLVVATGYAIEREMEMNVVLHERKNLVSLQKTIIELLDTGIIVVNAEGGIIQHNEKAQQILNLNGDLTGLKLSEVINCCYDFNKTMSEKIELDNLEIPVKIGHKHSYIGFSTAFIDNPGDDGIMVIRIREPASIRHLANMAGGSQAIYTFADIIGEDGGNLEKSLRIAHLASKNNTNVLISGESGTGKELVAQSIHNASSRKNMPFVAINCGALSRELIQSELFGYEGGAFTGAKKNGNPGKFELADGGTLFLDEIGEMPLDAQTNLLRVLQSGDVLRIGARHPNRVDVRVIAATNKNLEEEIKCKNFRHDLYYRLNVIQINLPPLRERKKDIDLLANHFLKRFSGELQFEITGFSPEAFEAMLKYEWPGNIRELENTVERAVLIAERGLITIEDLPETVAYGKRHSEDTGNTVNGISNINDFEIDYIKKLLTEHKGNLRAASAVMGVARSTLYNKIDKYQLNVEDYR